MLIDKSCYDKRYNAKWMETRLESHSCFQVWRQNWPNQLPSNIYITYVVENIRASCAQSITRPSWKIPSLNKLSVWYRKNRYTELASALLLDDIQKSVDCRELVETVFIDLSKVLDTIGHEILLSKLPSYGIRNTELTLFTDYLFSRKQLVNFEKYSLKKESVLCGVPQGSILGPLLFMIRFNDFYTCLRHAKTIKFADATMASLGFISPPLKF